MVNLASKKTTYIAGKTLHHVGNQPEIKSDQPGLVTDRFYSSARGGNAKGSSMAFKKLMAMIT